jgi:predicted acetyltransferase
VTVEVRPVAAHELHAYVDALSTGFLERPDIGKVATVLEELWDLERTWGAFDNGRVCGTFRSWPTELTVPGCDRLPGAAVAAVTVLPTHRRRGVLRAMLAAEHAAIRERGEAVAMLYASEYPIYGRFGYGMASRQATWTLDATATAFHGPAIGGVELVTPTEASRDEIRPVFDAWRLRQPGEIGRRPWSWDFDLALRDEPWGPTWKGFLVLRRNASGDVDGYARYHVDEKWIDRQPRNGLIVDELHALGDEPYRALWRFLAEVDWVATVKAERRSPSERLPWLLTNARAAILGEVGDGLWVRLFDIPRALEARSYERSGRVILEIRDAEAASPTRIRLDAEPAGARCQVTTESPDLTLDLSALGAAYLGGTRLRDAVRATGVDEHRPGALADADALFRTADEPWCSTFF